MNSPLNIYTYMRLDEINSVCTDAGLICNYDLSDKQWFHQYCQNMIKQQDSNYLHDANFGKESIMWSIKHDPKCYNSYRFLTLMLNNVPSTHGGDKFANVILYPYIDVVDDILKTSSIFDERQFHELNYEMYTMCNKYKTNNKEHRNKYLNNGVDAINVGVDAFREIVELFNHNWRIAKELHDVYLFKRALGLITF